VNVVNPIYEALMQIALPMDKLRQGVSRLGMALGFVLLVASLAVAGTWEEVAKLTAGLEADPGDRFGSSAAISGNTAIVGVPFDKDFANNAGSVYVFGRDTNGAWTLIERLTALNPVEFGNFGQSVAIDGNRVIVGSPGTSFDKGAAYVFERDSSDPNNWVQVAELTATDGRGSDRFGISVGISGDTVVVGAFNDDLNDAVAGLEKSGSVYVFEPNGAAWAEIKKLNASVPVKDAFFGNSVGISGNTIIVGARGTNNLGSAFVFDRAGGSNNWLEVATLTALDPMAGDRFGASVAISGDTAVVGADGDDDDSIADASLGANRGSAYIFERNEGGASKWGIVKSLTAPDAAADDEFGGSVAISGDTVLIGADLDDDLSNIRSGSAYVFGRDEGGSGNWGQVAKLTASDPGAGDEFGVSVAISGNVILIGAHSDNDGGVGSGSAYVFESPSNLAALDSFQCREAKRVYSPRKYRHKRVNGVTHLKLGSHGHFELESFCSPVAIGLGDQEPQEVSDPDTSLTCYEQKYWKYSKHFHKWWKHKKHRRRSDHQELQITNIFGEQTLKVKDPGQLCLPSVIDETELTSDLNRFKCSAAKKARGTEFARTEVTVGDEILKVIQPVSLCTPVDEENKEIEDATTHLACYKVKVVRPHKSRHHKYSKWGHWKHRFSREILTVNNAFGEVQKLKVSGPETLCVPTEIPASSQEAG